MVGLQARPSLIGDSRTGSDIVHRGVPLGLPGSIDAGAGALPCHSSAILFIELLVAAWKPLLAALLHKTCPPDWGIQCQFSLLTQWEHSLAEPYLAARRRSMKCDRDRSGCLVLRISIENLDGIQRSHRGGRFSAPVSRLSHKGSLSPSGSAAVLANRVK